MSKIDLKEKRNSRRLDDMPFGVAGERRRLAMEKTKNDEKSLVAKIREEVRLWEQQNPLYARRQHNEKE